MVTFFIVVLVISQIICFYFFVLLNLKIAKFNDLEVRQDRLIREMDDAIAAYLFEMRDENDRFIQELSAMNNTDGLNKQNVKNIHNHTKEKTTVQPGSNEEVSEITLDTKKLIPKNIVTNAYNRYKNEPKQQKENLKIVETKSSNNDNDSFENKVMALHSEGKTIEEIAKITQKGKTEIELLLKFHA